MYITILYVKQLHIDGFDYPHLHVQTVIFSCNKFYFLEKLIKKFLHPYDLLY